MNIILHNIIFYFRLNGNKLPVHKEKTIQVCLERFINVSMTQKQIIGKVHGLKTKMDLLNLLNALKKEDLGKDYHRFTLAQLNYYCNPNRTPHKRYRNFTIPKKSGGVRNISAPVRGLKSMLTYLNIVLQAMYQPTDAAMGFVPGRSIADNAAMHTCRNYVFNTDLKDFFPSIQQPRIWKILQLKPFSLNKELASVIAGLCCMQDANGNGVLPQGSPCSPILTNIVCRNLDRRLTGLAKRFNLKYSRYADDITFSSDYNVFQDDSEFMNEFMRIVADQNFTINEKKTRLQKSGQRQEVTGLIVNKKVNIAKEYYRDIRSLLYIWSRYGKEQAYAKFCVRYKASKAYNAKKKGMPSMPAVISGKLLYLKMVMGEDTTAYAKLRDNFLKLCPEQKNVLKNTNLTYLASYRLDEFESAFGTNVKFEYKPFSNVSGKSKTMGSFLLEEERVSVSVNVRCDSIVDKYLANPDEKELEKIKRRLYISLSERGNDRFWLITIARMNNEHKKSYKGSYVAKVKVRPEEIKKEGIELKGEVYAEIIRPTEILENKDLDPTHPGPHYYNSTYRKWLPVDDEQFEDITDSEEIDAMLASLVSSGFDLNTLKEWDKIKKN